MSAIQLPNPQGFRPVNTASPAAPFEGAGYTAPKIGVAPQSTAPLPQIPVSAPPKPSKRSRGRIVVSAGLVALCAYAAYLTWTSFFRYAAYGEVSGRVIEISAPWEGAVHAWQVQEGESVRQGDTLVTLDSLDLRQSLAKWGDELRLAQAELQAEVSRLRWRSNALADRGYDAGADYYEAWGNLLKEQAKLTELELEFERAAKLQGGTGITQAAFEQAELERDGQRAKVTRLTQAVAERKARVDIARVAEDDADQLRPHEARIAAAQAEIARVEEKLATGRIRSPVDGLVVSRRTFAGEHAKAGETLVTVLERGSLEIVFYLRQSDAGRLSPGDTVQFEIEPYAEKTPGVVSRFEDELRPAPVCVKTRYRADERLLPVRVRPRDDSGRWLALRLGGVAKLPYRWWSGSDAATSSAEDSDPP